MRDVIAAGGCFGNHDAFFLLMKCVDRIRNISVNTWYPNGADAIIFTAGIGENAALFVRRHFSGISGLVVRDPEKNVFGRTETSQLGRSETVSLVIPNR